MQRWILNVLGAALLAFPVLVALFGANTLLTAGREGNRTAGMSESLSLLVTAGAYLMQWGPVLLGVLVIYYANRPRG